jgi:hypothetical protein
MAEVDGMYRKWKERNLFALQRLVLSIDPNIVDKNADHFVMINLEYKEENAIDNKFQIVSCMLVSVAFVDLLDPDLNPTLSDTIRRSVECLGDQLLCNIAFRYENAMRMAALTIPMGGMPPRSEEEKNTELLVAAINKGRLAMSKTNKVFMKAK